MSIIHGNDNANTLTGTASDDSIFGHGGNDTLIGGGGGDLLDGGTGTDRVSYLDSGAAVFVNLLTGSGFGGTAWGDSYASIENVYGSFYADILTGSDVANVLTGFDGDDVLMGKAGNDTLHGDGGDDVLDGGVGADKLIDVGGDSHDAASYANSAATVIVDLGANSGSGGDAEGDTFSGIEDIRGSAHADLLIGDGHSNVLEGRGGADILRGGAGGTDMLDGGAGDDLMIAGGAAEEFHGGAGNDTVSYHNYDNGPLTVDIGAAATNEGVASQDLLWDDVENVTGTSLGDDDITGSNGANVLTGLGGDDLLGGYAGDDRLVGGAGDDAMYGGNGADVLDGGGGVDWVQYHPSTTAITVNLTTGKGSGGQAAGDSFIGVENVSASGHADIITGNGSANWLQGHDSADTLSGEGGDDILDGGLGDDVLRGGAGADRLTGVSGIDTASYYTGSVGVVVNLATGVGSGGEAQGDTLALIENLSGSQGGDSLVGNSGANTLQGWNGDDLLTGAGGQDLLTGGIGADRFVYASVAQSPVGAGADRITDFSHAQGDRIDLSAIDAVTTVAGNQAFTFIGTALYSNTAGQLRYAQSGGNTTVAGDVDGDGTSDFHIVLSGTIALVAADFVL
ncbi:calcium-binding protein [Inquilinus sp. CA228]|uniref:calcium-binding protein n=1 Tax=Inquilinus sp. CA228 TaxID=3455609 RepID=UPI003F8D7AF1